MKSFLSLFIFFLSSLPFIHAAMSLNGSFDIIDEFFETDGANPTGYSGTSYATSNDVGLTTTSIFNFDIFDVQGAATNADPLLRGADGMDDIQLIITTTLPNVPGYSDPSAEYYAETYVNSVGIVSRIGNHNGSISWAPTTNNPGTRIVQSIEIRFLTLEVEVQDIGNDVGVSSSNTVSGETNAFEMSGIELLDASYSPFTPITFPGYVDERNATGYVGNGSKLADGDTQDAVGTSNATTDADGTHDDDSVEVLGSDAEVLALGATTRVGGVRFTHVLIDTQGTSDTGGFRYTATLNDLDLDNVDVTPEPSVALLLGLSALSLMRRRRA